MAQRGVPQSEVEKIVRNGPLVAGGSDDWLSNGSFGGKRVKVAFVEARKGRQRVLMVKTVILKRI